MSESVTKNPDSAPRVRFSLLSSGVGPRTCAHVCVASGQRLFVHGGKSTSDPSAKDVKNELWIFYLDERRWEDITDHQSPFLSQHCAQTSNDGARMFLIGGWNGHHRTFDVHSFVFETRSWETWGTSGFPVGAGLSSFAVVPLATETSLLSSPSYSSARIVTDDLFLVLGREGGLRTQRRSGNAFLLRTSLSGQSVYEPYTHGTASRSGHTATPLDSSSRVVLIGGRDDELVEFVQGVRPRRVEKRDRGDTGSGDPLRQFGDKMKSQKPMKKDPASRQRHVAVSLGGNAILIHGGETYNGKFKTPVNDVLVVWFEVGSKGKPSPVAKWAKVNVVEESPHLAGHTAVVLQSREIVLFGGFQSKAAIDHCYKLELL